MRCLVLLFHVSSTYLSQRVGYIVYGIDTYIVEVFSSGNIPTTLYIIMYRKTLEKKFLLNYKNKMNLF